MDLMEYRRKVIASSPHLSHAEGAVASFPDGTDLPLKSLFVNIEPSQSGTGDPSPTNIRPISGWSAIKVTRTWKNLFGGEAFRDAVLSAVSTATTGEDENGRYVTVTAGAAANQKIIFKFPFKTNTAYTFAYTYSKDNTNGITNIGFKYTDGANGYLSRSGTTQANTVYTETTQSARDKTIAYMMTVWGGGTAKIYYDYFGVFEVMDTYHPYTGTSVTIDLGRTVYGGTLNVLSGELVVDRAMVDLGTLTWTRHPTIGYFYAILTPVPHNYTSTEKANALCSIYPIVAWRDRTDKTASVFYASQNGVNVLDSSYTDAATFKAAMSGVQLCYKLATPQTYTLDPQTVRSLVGQNNIFSDTGNVALEYWAHP